MGQQKIVGIIFVFLATAISLHAQITAPSYENKVFDNDIMSVRMHAGNRALGMPIIQWNGTTALNLRFDDLMEDPRNFYYTIVHCDANWTPSRLRFEEYLDGFDQEEIWNYEYSSLTWINYIHYSLTLPNERTQFLVPGNYVVYVYEDDPDQPILTQRFVLMDTRIAIEADLRRAIGNDKIRTHQAIEFTATHKNFKIDDPSSDVKAFILQNENWHTMTEVPLRSFRGETLDYNYPGSIAFPGLKEYRQADLRSVDVPLASVKFIEKDDLGYRFFLHPIIDQRKEIYRNRIDLNGGYVIGNYDNTGAFQPNFSTLSTNQLLETRSEYARAVISLLSDEMGGKLYVTGKFCQWNLEEENRMEYNEKYGAYMAELWLKQGFYDYSIVAIDETKKPAVQIPLEGNWFETENDYLILMYHRGFNDRYDRPIGSFILEN